eukprot:scaffold669826_cov48-Prasinocladus_malaysianus.AAC.1
MTMTTRSNINKSNTGVTSMTICRKGDSQTGRAHRYAPRVGLDWQEQLAVPRFDHFDLGIEHDNIANLHVICRGRLSHKHNTSERTVTKKHSELTGLFAPKYWIFRLTWILDTKTLIKTMAATTPRSCSCADRGRRLRADSFWAASTV